MPKCVICKKDLNKEDAYMFIHVSKTGKEYKKYACSEEEVENDKRDKELYRQSQYLTDEIAGFTITNNVRNRELSELHEAGYSWEQIYRCIRDKKDYIREQLDLKRIDSDYQIIRYIMTVIKNTIYQHANEDKKKNEWQQYKQVEEEVDVEVEETIVPTDMKVKKRKKLF